MELRALMKFVKGTWPFDAHHYPRFGYLPQEELKQEAIKHIAQHQTKAAGQLAAICDAIDHGKGVDQGEILLITRKFLVNTLRLAEVAGITADTLATSVRKWGEEL